MDRCAHIPKAKAITMAMMGFSSANAGANNSAHSAMNPSTLLELRILRVRFSGAAPSGLPLQACSYAVPTLSSIFSSLLSIPEKLFLISSSALVISPMLAVIRSMFNSRMLSR